MCCARAPALARTPTERSAVKQLGVGWNWRDLAIGDRFVTYGRTLFEADLLNFVTLCGFSEELFTNKEYIKSHAPMRGGHPVPGALVYCMAEGLVIPTTLQGSGLAFLSMGFDIKGPTYVGDTIHVEIELTEIKPTSKDPSRALVRTTNDVKNQKGETVLVYTPLRMMQGR
jgi:acyl dehydratase